MSLSEHRYTARIAPCSTTSVDAIHQGQTVVDEHGQRITESIASRGLIWPLQSVPVLLDHNETEQVGFVTQLAERDGWYEATFVLDMDRALAPAAEGWLRVGTSVSIAAKSFRKDQALADLGIGAVRHTVAILEEVSILGPDVTPAYRGARVIRITERESPLDRLHRQRQERELEQAKSKPQLAKPDAA